MSQEMAVMKDCRIVRSFQYWSIAIELAHDNARRAKACIRGSEDSEYARALRTLPDFILDREN